MCDDRGVAAQGEAATEGSARESAVEPSIGESRWPPAVALVAFMVLNIGLRVWLPNESAIRLPWLVPAVEGVLLVVLVVGPASFGRHRIWVRRVAVAFVVLLVAAALWATILLIYDLIKGIGVTDSPSELLASGGVVWLGNNLAFALLYWLIDGGGPTARSTLSRPVDFAFTQQLDPELDPGWRPVFLDYLHLGFTNATAFSPTDVMPLVPWAKIAMAVQAVISLAILGLVIARAVNVFS
jgi:hypothetical protein